MSYQARITSEPLAFLCVLRIYYITVNSFPRIIICGSEINSQRTWKWRPPQWMDRAVNLILFSFGKITTKVFTRSVRVKYVVCSPTKLVLNLIELLSSTVWRWAHSLASKKIYDELDINNVCVLNIKAWFTFFDRQNPKINGGIDATLNLVEFIHLKVWRSLNSGQQRHCPRVCKIQRLSFQNCFAVSPIFGRETSFSSNSKNPIENLTVIYLLCREKLKNCEKQALDGYLKK